MTKSINWAFTAQVSDGPTQQLSGSIDIEGYEEIEVDVTAGASTKVNVQPADGGLFLLISSSNYDTLTYEVLDATDKAVGTPSTKTLDGPHILVGAGAVALLETAENTIKFSKGGSEDATVNILVGRDATP